MGRMVVMTVGLLAACNLARGMQDDGKRPTKHPAAPTSISGSTLTEHDMQTALRRLEASMRKVLHLSGKAKQRPAGGTKAATREQVVLELGALYTLAEPKFVFTPTKAAYNPARLTIRAGRPARPVLEKLIAGQFVSKVGPLAAKSTPNLTLDEFGEALGFFLARIADVTHVPSSKFSPFIRTRRDPAQPPGGSSKSNTPRKGS